MTNNNQPIFTIENGVLTKCNLNGNTDIVLPDTVREIGALAFLYCTNLSRIKCPNVQTIDNEALDGLTSLKEIILSENNPNYYFENGILYNKDQTEIIWCKKDLQSYTAPLSVVKIGDWAFSWCEKLTSIELPNVQEISCNAFAFCASLQEIILSGDNPNYHFEDGILYNKDYTDIIICCKKDLQSYTAPLSVVKIDDYAFYECENLESVSCPNVQEIGWGAFSECKNLSNIECPNVQEIGVHAFQRCKNLISIELPNVQTIGERAFIECINLSSILCPNVQEIDKWAFNGCTSLAEIILSENNTKYHFEDGILYNKDYTDIIICCKKDLQSYTAPLSVVKIDDYAFYECENLESVSCPNVQEIGWGAFSECKNLSNIECPNVREIGGQAFFRCENLVSIECPNVQEIGRDAFYRCENLIQMSIPYDLLQERKDIPTEQKLRIERRT